ncbi:hypothetical protein ACIU4M_00755 [Bacillus altitudinis]|uniref:hypothetical protein n=1 Tax=Bacillus altitudinis TaxID=293387 RepID=UPI00389A3E6A
MASVGNLSAQITLEGLDEISSQLSQVGQSMSDTGSHISAMGNSFSNSSHGINGLNNSMFHTATTIEGMEEQISRITNRIANFRSATQNADSATAQAYTATYNRLQGLRSEYSMLVSATRQYGAETAQRMVEAMKPMRALELKAKDIQKQWINMGLDTDQFNGDADAMMSSIEELGRKQKNVQDEMMKANKMGRISIMQQAGTMMNLSTQASKVSEAFKTQGSMVERMSSPALRAADGLNRMANRGNAAVIALRQLGPNANMKQLTDRIGMINQGLMRANMVAITGGLLSAFVYGGLAKGAMKSDKEFAKMANTLQKVWSEALQPMVEAFADVGKAIMPLLISLGKMVVSFNKAHPVLAKIIQGFLMLIPALILILSPLAIGIGMFAGMQAMFSALSVMIMPLITGLAAISAPVLITAGVIVGLIAVGVLLYKNWDTITKYCGIAWQWLKDTAVNIFTSIMNFFKQWGAVILVVLTGGIGLLVLMIIKHWDSIKAFTATAWTAIVNVIKTVWNGVASFFSALWSGLVTVFSAVWNAIVVVVQTVVTIIQTILLVAVAIIGTIISGILTVFSFVWNAIVPVVQTVFNMIKSVVKTGVNFITVAWNVFKAGVMAVWKFIYSNVIAPVVARIKVVVKTLTAVVVAIMNGIKTAFSVAWNFVANIVKAVVNRVKNIIKTIVTIASAVGSKVKSLFTTAWNAVATVVKAVVNRVKTIVQTIVTIVTAIGNKVKSIFQTAWNAVASVVTSVVNKVKSIVNGVIKVVTSVGSKIKSGFSNAWNAVSSKVASVIGAVKNKITGIWSTASSIAGKIKSVFSNIFGGIKIPHFSISNASLNPKDWFTKGMPKLNIAWHKNGGILDSSTLIGAGEAGAEAIVPLSSQRRMKPFAHAVASMMPEGNNSGGNTSIHVAQMIIREEADIQKVAQELNKLQDRKVRASGRINFA